MLAGYILNSSRDNYDYCEIGEDFLGESYPTDEEILGKGKSRKTIADLDSEQLTQFCGQYSDILLRAYKPMSQQLEENGQKELYYNIELLSLCTCRYGRYWYGCKQRGSYRI